MERMNEMRRKCIHYINSFPRHTLKMNHSGGEQKYPHKWTNDRESGFRGDGECVQETTGEVEAEMGKLVVEEKQKKAEHECRQQ